jgi:hypothetical protein
MQEEPEFERQTEEKIELVPPRRRPPTAVGAGTAPPKPPRPPARRPWLQPEPPRPPRPPRQADVVSFLRDLLSAGLDAADALFRKLADALSKAAR